MAFPEQREHLSQRDFFRVKSHLDDFGMVACLRPSKTTRLFMGQHGIVGSRHLAIGVAALHIDDTG